MKKNRFYLAIVLLSFVSLFIACNKDKDNDPDPEQSCTDQAVELSTAASAFYTNMTEANCEAYVDVAQDYVGACSEYITAEELEIYQESLANTDCSVFGK